jgi:hypothetical protein
MVHQIPESKLAAGGIKLDRHCLLERREGPWSGGTHNQVGPVDKRPVGGERPLEHHWWPRNPARFDMDSVRISAIAELDRRHHPDQRASLGDVGDISIVPLDSEGIACEWISAPTGRRHETGLGLRGEIVAVG